MIHPMVNQSTFFDKQLYDHLLFALISKAKTEAIACCCDGTISVRIQAKKGLERSPGVPNFRAAI